MSQLDTDQAQEDLNEQHIPIQYKIVDLPIINVPPVTILKTFNCKIYRKVQTMQNDDPGINGSAPTYEWKRKCYGKVRFVQCENGEIVVAAYQFGSCHLRMKEKPIVSDDFFALQISQQYEFNWQFKTSQGQTLSISLCQQDFQQFQTFWNNSKTKNTNLEQAQVDNSAPQQISSDKPHQILLAEPEQDKNPDKQQTKEQMTKQQ